MYYRYVCIHIICILCEKKNLKKLFLGEDVLPIIPAASQGSSTGIAKDVKPARQG